jgi:long-chain acyl-CoA synthetase
MRRMKLEDGDLLLDRVYRWERERGDVVWMVQPLAGGQVREYTWKQAVDEALRMAAYLKAQGFEPGSSIAILSKNCAHFILSELAIWMAGHRSVALYPTLNAETVRYILEHSEAKLLFVGKLDTWGEMKRGVPDGLPQVGYSLSPKGDYPIWEDLVSKTEPIEGRPRREASETALLMYTSGTTGRSKGVEHTFGSISFAAKGFDRAVGFRSDDRALSYLPLAHAFERAAVEAVSLRIGAQIYFAESLETFAADLRRARPTVFHSVPRLWLKFQLGVFHKLPERRLKLLLKIPIVSGIIKKKILVGLGLDATRMAVSGSAPIPAELIRWYRSLGLELLEGYAMSENFSYSHLTRPGRVTPGLVGTPLEDVEVRLSPEGEILVKSEATMKGYFKEPQLTAEAFTEDGFLRTGDRGEIDSDGSLRITGRVKELFKTSKGKYVAPAPIENLLNADSHVEQSCVTGHGQPQPHALILLSEELRAQVAKGEDKEEVERALAELLDGVNAQINQHEQLELLVVVKDPWVIENGFLTPTMKVKRSVIEERYGPEVEGWYASKKRVIWQT